MFKQSNPSRRTKCAVVLALAVAASCGWLSSRGEPFGSVEQNAPPALAGQPAGISLNPNGVSTVGWMFNTTDWIMTRGHGEGDHTGDDYFALDFARACDTSGGEVRTAGQSLYAAISGLVYFDDNGNSGYGKSIVIVDPQTHMGVRYAHMQEYAPELSNGSCVNAGQYVGKVGKSGNTVGSCTVEADRGAHLHMVLYRNVTNPASRPVTSTSPGDTNSPYAADFNYLSSRIPPSPPNGVMTTTVSSSELRVTWLYGCPEGGFEVERRDSAAGSYFTIARPGQTTSFSDTNLAPSSTHCYRIRALRGLDTSLPSAETCATTGAQPTPTATPRPSTTPTPSPTPTPSTQLRVPTDLAAYAISNTDVEIRWRYTWNHDAGDPDIIKVEARNSNSSSWNDVCNGDPANSYCLHSGAQPGQMYKYRARAAKLILTPFHWEYSGYSNESNWVTTPNCTFSISPIEATFGAEGGSGSFNVETQSGCVWDTGSLQPWTGSGSRGVGSGTASYSVGPNREPRARVGTILAYNQRFTVRQDANNTFRVATYSPTSGYNVNSGRWLTGDWNGDGKIDLMHLTTSDYVHPWISQGDGSFAVSLFRATPGYNVNSGRWFAGRLNGDGKTDLVHVTDGGYVHTWFSNGDGTFNVGRFDAWPGYDTLHGGWLSGDLNGDGLLDLVHLTLSDYVHTWIARGDGRFSIGAFRPWSGYSVFSGRWVVADLDGDHRDDLVHITNGGYVHPWLSNGDGNFRVKAFGPWAGYHTHIGGWLTGDWNGDGRTDLLHVVGSDYVHPWLSNGDGSFNVGAFSPVPGYQTGSGRWVAGDLNADGKTDLVHLTESDYVHPWLSRGSGFDFAVSTFSQQAGYSVNSGRWLTGDVSGDGKTDLVHLTTSDYIHPWISGADASTFGYRIIMPGQSPCPGCPVSDPGNGGQESSPTWMWQGERRRADNAAYRAALPAPRAQGPRQEPPPLWRWVNGATSEDIPTGGKRPPSEAISPNVNGATLSLSDLMPEEFAGNRRVLSQPRDVIGNSNAEEALAASYHYPDTDTIVAGVVGFKTQPGVYTHDYAVCARFKAGLLEDLSPTLATQLPGDGDAPAYFWETRMAQPLGERRISEHATFFAVYVSADGHTFTVDSRWRSDQYPPAADGYVLTFQVWSPDAQTTTELRDEVLQAFAARGTLSYRNTQTTSTPSAFIEGASYNYGEVTLTMLNDTGAARDVVFDAVMWSAPNPESETRHSFTRAIAPGLNVIRLPIPGQLNGVVYAHDGDFVDYVYVADGHWFAFDDSDSGGTSEITWSSHDCGTASNLTARDFVVAGCAEMQGQIGLQGWGGLARALDPPTRPFTDVMPHRALTFFAKGDGKSYRVGIETDAVVNMASADWHQFVFSAPPEGRQFVIPLDLFKQQGWDANKITALTARDVKALVWSPVGDPHGSVNLSVSKVAFFDSLVITDTTRLPDTNAAAVPFPVTTKITDDVGVQSASLLYSVDGGVSYTRVPMSGGGESFAASLPGQALGTEVRYYVEATDADGNRATDPVDAPATTYRFQVGGAPRLLVEDFSDTNPANILGGDAFLFGRDTGGLIEAHYDRESLRLDYDVSADKSFAGYSTLLRGADLGPYNVVSFLVKGSGGERFKVGLRDSAGHEQKIVAGQYMPDGVLISWRKVTIPLAAFNGVTNLSSVESFVVAFESRIGSGRGTIFLDDIRFEKTGYTPPVVIDNYNDMASENGLGGSLWTAAGGAVVTTVYDASNRAGGYGAGRRVSFGGVTPTAWAAAGTDLLGFNASAYQTLSFDIKGASGGERPNIYLASRVGEAETRKYVDIENYANVTTSWRRVEIPLSAFASQGVDLTRLAYLQVVFEFENMAGTIYLDNVTFQPAVNQIEDATFYVRQHYVDFLGREPDPSGLAFWTSEITNCGVDAQCREVKRINVSAAFYLSIEFQQTGYLAYRAYKAAFGDMQGKPVPITREEMLADMRQIGRGVVVGQANWEQRLEQNKRDYFDQLVALGRFTDLYPQTLTPEQFVDALNAHAGGALSQGERDALVGDLKSGAKTRAQALRAVAEDADLARAEFNGGFVLMQYFGYLRRNPDDSPDANFSGFNFWLTKLNEFHGDYIAAEMVKAFISSIEYGKRFGQ